MFEIMVDRYLNYNAMQCNATQCNWRDHKHLPSKGYPQGSNTAISQVCHNKNKKLTVVFYKANYF